MSVDVKMMVAGPRQVCWMESSLTPGSMTRCCNLYDKDMNSMIVFYLNDAEPCNFPAIPLQILIRSTDIPTESVRQPLKPRPLLTLASFCFSLSELTGATSRVGWF